MKVYKFYELPEEYRKIVELPEDLMMIDHNSFLTDTDTVLCHSDTENKWYILVKMSVPDTENNINYWLYADGKWIDCILSFNPFPNWLDAPFKWGEIMPSSTNKKYSYLPIWQRVPTGEFDENDMEIYRDDYKIICIYQVPNVSDDRYDFRFMNQFTGFEVVEFGENLVDMVKNLQYRTGKHF